MKLRRVRIVIQPLSETKGLWTQALKGEVRTLQKPGVLIFTSLAAAAKVLSPARLELLGVIVKNTPESIYALSKLLDRDFKNVHSDVRLLADVGLIDLKMGPGKRDAVKPVARYTELEFDLAA